MIEIRKRPAFWDKEKLDAPEKFWNRKEVVREVSETRKIIDDKEFAFLSKWALAYIPEDAVIGDFGCGTGRAMQTFRDKNYSVIGIDCSEGLLKVANSKLEKQANAKIVLSKIQDIEFEAYFDLVMMFDVLQHQHNEERDNIIKKVHGALKPNGIFFLCEKTNEGEGKGEKASEWIRIICDAANFLLLKHEEAFYLMRKQREK